MYYRRENNMKKIYVLSALTLLTVGLLTQPVKPVNEVKENVQTLTTRMIQSMRRIDRNARTSLQKVSSHPYLKDPNNYLKEYQMKVLMLNKALCDYPSKLASKRLRLNQTTHLLLQKQNQFQQEQMLLINRYKSILEQSMQKQLIQKRHRYVSLIELLEAYSPLSVLKRGYAITMKDEHVIKSVDEIESNEQIKIKMNDGIIYANVTNKEKNDGTKQDLSTIITSPRNHCK